MQISRADTVMPIWGESGKTRAQAPRTDSEKRSMYCSEEGR